MTIIHKNFLPYIPRVIETKLQAYLDTFPVTAICGPRQSGKSTLLQHALNEEYQYVTFDDARLVTQFKEDPLDFMQRYDNKVIFDEAQYVPQLFQELKIAVDQDRNNRGKFIITGSSQFHLLKNITESLAGRVGLLTLLPFQYSEIPANLRDQSLYLGCYPEMVDLNYRMFDDWFNAYISSYLERDVRGLHNIGDLLDFKKLIQMLAANTSQILDYSFYAKNIGVAVNTIKRWISILEASYVVFLLPSYHKNQNKRIIKRPKVYFWDTGLVSHLTRNITKELYENGPMTGFIYENYIISQILKREKNNVTHTPAYFYRDSNGVEVDLILERAGYRELIEIKHSATPTPKMTKAIESLRNKNDQNFVIYQGRHEFLRQVHFINYKDYLESPQPFSIAE